MLKASLAFLGLFLALNASASMLKCALNDGEFILINPEKSKISYKMFDFNERPMKMNYFNKARCPSCYSFSGNIIGGEFDGLKFEGTTTGTMTKEGYQVSMKLVSPKIEAGKSFPCK